MSLLEGCAVTKRFGGLHAIEGLDFVLQAGEVFALIGPNGAGKTTLVNVITGLLPLDDGVIRFKGRPLDRLRPFERNRLGIARTFQVVRPFRGLTVLDNVLAGALFGRASGTSDTTRPVERAEAILDLLGLTSKARLPAEQLTVADKKRVELARALATRPELMLLDEVMSGLTPTEVDEMIALVRRINRTGVTVMLIEHVMRAVMTISDRILVLHHGRRLAEGDAAGVAGNPDVIAAYLGRRARPA